MAATRILLRNNSRPLFQLPHHLTPFSNSLFLKSCVRYHTRASLNNGDHHHVIVSGRGERKPPVPMLPPLQASMATTNHVATSKPVGVREGLMDLAAIIARVRNAMLVFLRSRVKRIKKWNLQPQMLIETAIIDCRFFTLFAVAGTLLGSVLCFVEGCLLVIESYAQYFQMLSQRLVDQGHLVHLLIEAIDMFLVGTALLVFGVGLYVMFVGSRTTSKEKEQWHSGSNLMGLFHMKSPPRWVGMNSIEQAKSKIGHAVMMILQVGLLEKFKDIPLVTSLDLACFASAVLTSSACIFVLSKLQR